MRTLAALVFPGFQTLDYFGPIEMIGDPAFGIEIMTVAKTNGPIPSRHGQKIVVDKVMSQKNDYDLLLIPGGDSALTECVDEETLDWIRDVSKNAERVMAVCTGTIILGMSGVLNGRKATTNKLDFIDTVPLAPEVNWVKEARWIEDGKYFTSSGVSAGMDMTLAVVADLLGMDKAEETANSTEYYWNRDSTQDPFAKAAGLV
jgi:transcriptional regulator GlxA family with amidase domain